MLQPPCEIPLHSDHQDRDCPFQALQKGRHQAVPQLKDQVPPRVPKGQATDQEAEGHVQGIEAKLVHVIGLWWML